MFENVHYNTGCNTKKKPPNLKPISMSQNNKTQLWNVHTKDYYTTVENEETTAAFSNMDIS